MKLSSITALVLAILAAATIAGAQSKTIILVRHAEKPRRGAMIRSSVPQEDSVLNGSTRSPAGASGAGSIRPTSNVRVNACTTRRKAKKTAETYDARKPAGLLDLIIKSKIKPHIVAGPQQHGTGPCELRREQRRFQESR